MSDKQFKFEIDNRSLLVKASEEGVCRYMVRMEEPGRVCSVRIAYLTGSGNEWVVEMSGQQSSSQTSAKAACEFAARWALTQPTFASKG